MMALLLEPLQFTFMSHALLISLVVSIPCALLSVFLVLKGWALMGDAMSHAVFPGIVLAWILRLPLMTGVWLSFFIDSAPAPTIVVLFAVVFIMTFTVTSINARTKGNTHTQDLSSPN
ncbi:hypothetical protein A8C90_004423 [Escherichia coli]|nr:hypothetical protein [Escherichia coli]